MKKNKAVKVVEKKDGITKAGFSMETLIMKAVERDASVETLERILAMRRELKAELAKEQYDQAMAKFQSECPEIKKTKEVKDRSGRLLYAYAPIESIVKQVKDDGLIAEQVLVNPAEFRTTGEHVCAVRVATADGLEAYDVVPVRMAEPGWSPPNTCAVRASREMVYEVYYRPV